MRAHSKFSASGAERWFECSASVEACEGKPDIDTEWSKEGTLAHWLLEQIMLLLLAGKLAVYGQFEGKPGVSKVMFQHAKNAADFIVELGRKIGAEVLVESRVFLSFIHPEAFGTLDGAVLDYFGTLHVFDFKYGAGHAVRPEKNLQMIFYALALAYKYQWNFARVRLWIIQPRIRGYDGPTYWDVPLDVLQSYVAEFTKAVWRVENNPKFKEGPWCHWCKAKKTCPLKRETRETKAVDVFSNVPLPKGNHDEQKESPTSEADWRKESKKRSLQSKKARSQQKAQSREAQKESKNRGGLTYEGITRDANRIARDLDFY
jgi:hypothetical protein